MVRPPKEIFLRVKMKISITRSGGFAGLSEEVVSLDTAKLEKSAAKKVEDLVREISFFALPASPAGQSLGSDFLKYEITVADQGREHKINFNEDTSPATALLSKFVQQIEQLSGLAGK